ncbi:hypothetical protein [Streptomyces sp. N35]|uniref:hypothetical protein n=1 Tax=Streptomyces sp. N35 TaxID=2795730 RepID=UPI0018F429E6|nr:hypothetical protein [Streptomyces sp. N35]
MRLARLLAGTTATLTATIGLGLATAGSASADDGSWRAYGNTNPITSSSSTWKCASTVSLDTSVGAQVCVIRSASGGSVQGAVIVRNNRDSLYRVSATVSLYNSAGVWQGGTWHCAKSGVGANSWSVCYGKTVTTSASRYAQAAATGTEDTESLGRTQLI